MLLWLAWVFLLVGSLGSFGLYGAKVVAGSPSDAIKPSVWGKVVGSHTASVLLVRVVLVLVLGVLLLTFARRAGDIWRGGALAISVGLILTYSSIGHANAQHPAPLWIGVDAVHLTAVSLWIGGLLMFAFGTSTWLTDPDAERIVRRFSVVATGRGAGDRRDRRRPDAQAGRQLRRRHQHLMGSNPAGQGCSRHRAGRDRRRVAMAAAQRRSAGDQAKRVWSRR